MLPNSFWFAIGAGSRQLDPPALQKFSGIMFLPDVHVWLPAVRGAFRQLALFQTTLPNAFLAKDPSSLFSV